MKRLCGSILLMLLFLAVGCGESKRGKGDTRLQDGVEVEDLTVGEGPEAADGDTVWVHYTGWLTSGGKKFDSSRDSGEPLTFPLGRGKVIKGWDNGVVGMKVGGKRKLYIPAALAYGSSGAGEDIPPDADLTFEVELLKIGR